jgi:hypothetical protein
MTEVLGDFEPRDVRRVVDLGVDAAGDALRLIELHDGDWALSHVCDRTNGPRGYGGVVRCAPRLTDHQIEAGSTVTITPSCLCPDCGLHGYVTASVWRDA